MDRANDAVLFLARLLMAALFLPSGVGKAMNFAPFAATLANTGLPYTDILAAVAVAIEILGPIALILGFLPGVTAWILIAFVVAASATSHRYWEIAEAAARRGQEINFFKNIGITAGLLFYSVSGAGAWSLAGLMDGKPASDAPKASQPAQTTA